jgi:hypothetical protein
VGRFPAQEAATAARGKKVDDIAVAVGGGEAKSDLPVGRDEGVVAVIGLEEELDEREVPDRGGELQRGAADGEAVRMPTFGLCSDDSRISTRSIANEQKERS